MANASEECCASARDTVTDQTLFCFCFFQLYFVSNVKGWNNDEFLYWVKADYKCCETFKNFLRSYQNGAYICIVDILLWVTANDPWSLVIHEPVTTSGPQTRKGKASALFTTSSTFRTAVILHHSWILPEDSGATFSFTALEHPRFEKVKAKE